MNESIKILLIEDDSVDRIFFERALKAADIVAELVVAEDAENGTSDFCKDDFTCVFLDYMLPGTDGLSLLKKLHAEKDEIPIILITSHGDEKIAVNAMKAGAMDYIPKNLITPLSLGQIIRNVIRFKEIEHQKITAENIVKQNEKRHRIFFEKSQIFLCTHDLNGIFINVNEAGAKSLGYCPEDLIGTNLEKLIAPSHDSLFRDYLKNIVEEKTAMGLLRVMTQTGKERIWMYHNSLYEESANENYVIGSIQDITERIKMEEEMRAAKLLAEESVKIKEQFLANMSHEIRTPMSAIIGFTRLILETKLNEEQKEYLETINYSAKNLLSIINDILDFSKIKSGKMTLEETDFDLSILLNSLFSIFQPEAAKKNIKLICSIAPEVPNHFKGDSVRLNQILLNLFSNALKFTYEGSVKLNVELSDKKDDYNTIEFTVEDTGIGIPEDKLDTIFESFTQASSDTTRKYGGTGLGLAIVKDLVTLHGGKIKAMRNPEKGTKFVFNVFLKDGPPETSVNKNAISNKKMEEGKYRNLKGINILLVEDNKFNQLLAKKTLENMACNVDIAKNGIEAVDKLNLGTYDIVLMDIQMPEMDGYAATQHIRTKLGEKVNRIPIIAMTAHALNDEGSKCIHAGMNDYISKPFEPEVLYSKISVLVLQQEKIVSDEEETVAVSDSLHIEMQREILDLTHLKQILGDNTDCLVEVLKTLHEELPILTENIKISGMSGDWKQLSQHAHKMKSCIMMTNTPHFLAILDSLEKQEELESDPDSLALKVKQAISMGSQVISQVKKALESLQSGGQKSGSKYAA